MRKAMACLAGLLLASGCASVTRGTMEDVTIKALPEDAAIRTSLNHSCPRSPCTVNVSRKKAFVAYADREGYKPGSIEIKTRIAGGGAAGFAGNVILGGIVGMTIDAASGATLDHWPNPAVIVLQPLDPANPKTPIYSQPAPPPPTKPESRQPVS